MHALASRAQLNGIKVDLLDAAALKEREPNVAGVGALFVAETGIVDYRLVCEGMANDLRQKGAMIQLGVAVTAIKESDAMLHVCNAPSPAATSALPIGEMIAGKVITRSAGF
jgi:L-2-hydroxyglutarate oxidase